MTAQVSEGVSLPAGNIVLVGFMGCGKTEVGRALAERTGRRLIDVDDVVASEGQSVTEIFLVEGEKGFRRRERKAVEKAARTKGVVIATGGGAVLDPSNVTALKRSGVLVYLKVDTNELVRRLKNGDERPLLRSAEGSVGRVEIRKRVETLMDARRPIYESVADHVVRCDGKAPREVADDIVRRLKKEPSPTKRVRVALEPSYTVSVGRDVLGSLPGLVKLPKAAEKACIVSHPRLRRLWGEPLERALRAAKLEVTWSTFPEGEERKTPDTAARLAKVLARDNFHRSDVLLALGGGVVGDVGGFVASTFARGIACVQVPTTLLAMVDSAIGGKTGVNLPQGKNLVGTFTQPLAVVADLNTLSTLPERELRGGLAEVIKYSFISEPSLGELVVKKRDEIFARGDVLEPIVVRCARIKANIVASDEREQGLRAILNYGHTLGHAIESLSLGGRTRSGRLHHGEAISIGMVYAAKVSELAGVAKSPLVDDHRATLEAVGLPTRIEGVSWNDARDRMMVDKKYSKGLRFVLLTEAGKPVVERVPQKVLAKAFEEVSG